MMYRLIRYKVTFMSVFFFLILLLIRNFFYGPKTGKIERKQVELLNLDFMNKINYSSFHTTNDICEGNLFFNAYVLK